MAFMSSQFFVYVNSQDRLNQADTNSNFTYNIALPQDHKFTHVSLIDATIPKSYYLIQSGYNTFQLTEGATTVTITVPIGNYQLSQWTTTLTSLLTTNSPNGWVYTVTYPFPSTSGELGKLLYTVSGNTSQPILTFGAVMYEPFGFRQSSSNQFSSSQLLSTTVIKLQSEDRLLLHCDIINNPGNDNVLAAINAGTVVPMSTIVYENQEPDIITHELTSDNIKTIRITLQDENGIEQILNGLNMNLTLMFYKKEPVWDTFRRYVELEALKNK